MARWVVVGGGAAGCVVAARLSDRAADDVVLVETGPLHASPPAAADRGPYIVDPTRLAPVTVVRRPGSAPEPYLQGVGLGGSSLVNGALVMGDVTPDAGRGHDLPLEPPWEHGPLAAALLATDRRARPVRLIRRDRRRVTVADAYLTPLADRPNLTVRTAAEVVRVRLDGTVAVGVELADGSVLDADRVVLTAGAIRTPALLLRSGVRVPGIGEQLADHPAFTITLALREDRIDSTAPTISVAAVHPDHVVIPIEELPTAAGFGAIVVALTDVRGEGRVTIDDTGATRVELDQLEHADDRRRMVAAVRGALRLLDAAPFRDVTGAFIDDQGTPVTLLTDDPTLIESWILDHLGGLYHAAGTCRDGVVCDGGVVRGYRGLYVADASALPGVPPVDPYLAVVRQAERFAVAW